MRRVAVLVAALTAFVVAAACTSSSKPSRSDTPLGSSSSATLSPTPTPVTPKPSPTKSAPLSRFEADPAVAAMRAWSAQVAKDVNAGGKFNDPALLVLETKKFASQVRSIIGTDVGTYYPGPAPFTPLAVTVVSPTERKIKMCIVSTGFAQNSKTHKPAKKLKLLPSEAVMPLVSGDWKLDSLTQAPTTSCAGVKVPMPTW